MKPAGPYAEVVSALLEAFFPPMADGKGAIGLEESDLVAGYARLPGNHNADIAAEVLFALALLNMHDMQHPCTHQAERSKCEQVLRTLQVLAPESQRDLFL